MTISNFTTSQVKSNILRARLSIEISKHSDRLMNVRSQAGTLNDDDLFYDLMAEMSAIEDIILRMEDKIMATAEVMPSSTDEDPTDRTEDVQ